MSNGHCDFCTYKSKVNEAHRDNPNWRYGQTAFNVLADLEPELASEIRGTVLDPYYDSERLADFMLWVEKRLGSDGEATATDVTVMDASQYDDLTASLELADPAPKVAEVAAQPRRYERPAFAGIFSGPSGMAETVKQVARGDAECHDCGGDGTPCRECPAVA